ncbi:unknown [Clostridium sp. CAG:1024]|nr:unknown [Clostridium sp. CAG:1024]
MSGRHGGLLFKEVLRDLIDHRLVEILTAHERSKHGDGLRLVDAVGGGGDDGFCIEGVLFKELVRAFAVDRNDHDLFHLGKLLNGRVRQSRGSERGIHGAVLHGGRGLREGEVLYVKIVVAQAVGFQHLLGVRFGAGALIADADALALEVGNGVDVRGLQRNELYGFRIQRGDRAQLRHGAVLSHGFGHGFGAGHRIVQDVILHNGKIRLPVVQRPAVCGGSAGSDCRDLKIVNGAAQHIRDHAAKGIVSAGVTARDHDQTGERGDGQRVFLLP